MEEIKERYDIDTNFIELLQLRHAVPLHWKKDLDSNNNGTYSFNTLHNCTSLENKSLTTNKL